ncbi:class I adenylate-forming enzyme family protein [Xylophilus sp. GOD-11R]|uniref:class I adenylate-forming enzyme family protein n=1 Tax=Xylophilus sp. GOD-11R TaxID=3089814 RepID=UPI00298C6E4C|nr:class I adenylate-forming enzyme family protein [Xylophilus sp. GOD-11R]WPB56297.1 class I adenylate-forming enzyme family protein [Xylophilus sp. GOD-11R]
MLFNLGKLTDPSKDPKAVALIDCTDFADPQTYTHESLDMLAYAFARGLVARGLQPGDSVALMAINSAQYLIAYLGTMRAGMVAVPVNYKLAQDTIELILNDCAARLVLVDGPRAGQLPPGTDAVRLDNAEWSAFLDHGPFETVRPAPNACAMILYTSGSTGRPKGVQLSHEGQLWALEARTKGRAAIDQERFIVAAPLFHMNALASCKLVLVAHASMVLLPQFEAKQFIAAIERFGVTWVTSVPTMMAMVVAQKEALAAIDTRHVRYVRMGSAPATDQLYAAVQAAFPKATLAGGYGTTEGGPVVFGPAAGKTIPGGGLGWPSPGVEVRLVGPGGDSESDGELWMRTPANMLGYLNLPEKTRQVLTEDNWYKSGDVFHRDPQGCYFFVGRVDDMFNCGGENIYPGEVEQVIERMPAVMQAIVVPVPDEIKGQKPVAFVVLRAGHEIGEDEVKNFVLANAPAYQHPRKVWFLDSLPLAATNKVDRRELMRLAQAPAAAVSA